MHFDYYGQDDREAGQKTLKQIREMGCDVPVVVCSSQNWKIPETAGTIFYNPRRNWEREADEVLKKVL